MNNNISVLAELIEHCSEANKLLTSNAIAMENGEILEAQNNLKEATSLLSVMIKDIFVEVKEIVSVTSNEEEPYDFSILDISKLLSKICYNAASLISCYIDEQPETIKNTIETKLIKSINATKSLVLFILLN